MKNAPMIRTMIRRLAAIFAFGGVAFAAFGLDDAAQDVAGRVVEDAYNGNPLAIGILIFLLLSGGALWVAERMLGMVSKWRTIGKPATGDQDQKDHAEIRGRLEALAAALAELETEITAGQRELKAEIKGLRRDVDRLDRERPAG